MIIFSLHDFSISNFSDVVIDLLVPVFRAILEAADSKRLAEALVPKRTLRLRFSISSRYFDFLEVNFFASFSSSARY
jgi:hypothetical protein